MPDWWSIYVGLFVDCHDMINVINMINMSKFKMVGVEIKVMWARRPYRGMRGSPGQVTILIFPFMPSSQRKKKINEKKVLRTMIYV